MTGMWRVAALVAVALLAVATASATNVACPTEALNLYETSFTSAATACQIGDVLFWNFTYNPYPTGAMPAASSVTVTPAGTGLQENPTGFTFTASGWLANGTTTLGDVALTYYAALVGTPTGAGFTRDSLSVTDLVDGGAFQAGETAQQLSADLSTPSGTVYTLPGIYTTSGGTQTISAAVGGVGLEQSKDLSLLGGSGDFVEITSFDNLLTWDAPEPGTLVLMSAGAGLLFLLRRSKKLLGILSCLALVALFAGSAHAVGLCTSGNFGTSSYGAPGFSCTIGDVMFSDFTLNFSGTADIAPNSGTAVNPSSAIGLYFNPIMWTSGSETGTVTISYQVEDATDFITGFSANAVTSTFGGGTASGSVTFGGLASEALPPGGGIVLNPALAPGTPETITDTVTLSGIGHLSAIENDFTVPEPLTFVLVGSALVGLGLAVRKKKV